MMTLPQSMRVTSSPSISRAASSWSSHTSCRQSQFHDLEDRIGGRVRVTSC